MTTLIGHSDITSTIIASYGFYLSGSSTVGTGKAKSLPMESFQGMHRFCIHCKILVEGKGNISPEVRQSEVHTDPSIRELENYIIISDGFRDFYKN